MNCINLDYSGGSEAITFQEFADLHIQDEDAAFKALRTLLEDGTYKPDNGDDGPVHVFTIYRHRELLVQAGDYAGAVDGNLDILYEHVPENLLAGVYPPREA